MKPGMGPDPTRPSANSGAGTGSAGAADRVAFERHVVNAAAPTVTPGATPEPEGDTPAAGSNVAEAANAVRSVKQGVAIGTKLGGVHGAAVGAVAGGLKAVSQSKHRKKLAVALLCLLIPNLLLAVLVLLPLAALTGTATTTQVETLAMSRSRDTGAITGAQATDYAQASARSGINWAVLAALESETSTGGDVAQGADSGVPTPNPNPGAILSVQIASWNALKTQPTSRVIAGIRAIAAAGAEVIGLQEITPDSKRNRLRSRLGPEWGMSQVDNAVIILWRRDKVDLVAQPSERVFDVVHVESGGIGGGSFGPKSLQWAEFKTRDTGAHFTVINNHLLPTIETRGHPNKRFPKRVDGAEKQMAAAMAAADKLQAAGLATFITGDHNIAAKTRRAGAGPALPVREVRKARPVLQLADAWVPVEWHPWQTPH